MLNFEEKVYTPKPFFKTKMMRYSVFYFPKDPKSKGQVVIEMTESTGKNGNARIYKGEKFKMHLSPTEVAGLIARMDFILNNYHFIFSEKNYNYLAVGGRAEFEHFPPAKDGVKNKTIFGLRLADREAFLNSLKEEGEFLTPIVTVVMGKKGLSFAVSLTRDELSRMREDFKMFYQLLFALDTVQKSFGEGKPGEDNSKAAEETTFDFE